MTLTKPQSHAFLVLSAHDKMTKKELLAAECDMRAVNALVRDGYAQLDGDVYAAVIHEPDFDKIFPTEDERGEPLREAPSDEALQIALTANEAEVARRPGLRRAPRGTPKVPVPCKCGCGSLAKKAFIVGHDGRLHGIVISIAKGKAPMPQFADVTLEYLATAAWVPAEFKSVLASR